MTDFTNSDYKVLVETGDGVLLEIPYSNIKYDKEPIDIKVRPMATVTIPNLNGEFTGKFFAGQKLVVYRNGVPDFPGIIEPWQYNKTTTDVPIITIKAKHEAWVRLEAHICDDYDYDEDDIGLADAIVNPWEWRIFRNLALSITDVGQHPAVDGIKPNKAFKALIGTLLIHQNFFEDMMFFRQSSASGSNLSIYMDAPSGDQSTALALVRTGATSFATTGTLESIPIYNGDPNIDPMGTVSTVTITIYGERASSSNPTVQACRNSNQGVRTYTTLTQSSFTNDVSGAIDKWVFTGDLSADGASIKNEFGYKITLPGSGIDTTRLFYLQVEAVTVSDTGLTNGQIDDYVDTSGDDPGNDLDDGRNFVELSVAGKTRIDGIADVQGLTVSADLVNPSPHWDVFLSAGLELNFIERRGVDRTVIYSFGNDHGKLKLLEHEFEGDFIYYQVIGLGGGSGIARSRIVSKEDYDKGGLYFPSLDPASGNQYRVAAKVGVYDDSNIVDATTLLRRARAFAKLHRTPISRYQIEVEPEFIDRFDVGDAILIDDIESEANKESLRVVAINRTIVVGQPEKWNVEVGQPTLNIATTVAGLQGQIVATNITPQPSPVEETPTGEGVRFNNTVPGKFAFDITDPQPGDIWQLNVSTLPWQATTTTGGGGGGTGITWTEVSTSQTMAVDTGYVVNSASLITLTLPASPAFGKVIEITGKGSGGWKIAQGAGQGINFGSVSTTTGTTGSLTSTNARDSILLVCITGGTSAVWNVRTSQGNIEVV